jgi:hypothetical protein
MFRKILIYGTALFVTGCYDPEQKEYDIQQVQHERSLDQIMGVYDTQCSVDRGPAYLVRNDSLCDGLREAYWAIQSDRNLQGFPEYEKMREAKNNSEPSAR